MALSVNLQLTRMTNQFYQLAAHSNDSESSAINNWCLVGFYVIHTTCYASSDKMGTETAAGKGGISSVTLND